MEGDALLIVQLSLAASLAAQGVTVDPTSIAIIGIYYYVEVPAPTSTSATTGRRLLVIISACCHWLLEADLVHEMASRLAIFPSALPFTIQSLQQDSVSWILKLPGCHAQADADRQASCPTGAVCSVEVVMAVTPPANSNPTLVAAAAFQSLSTNTFQVGRSAPG